MVADESAHSKTIKALVERRLAAEWEYFVNSSRGRATIEFNNAKEAIDALVRELSPSDKAAYEKELEAGRKAGRSSNPTTNIR